MDLTPFLEAKGERILKGVTGVVHQGKGTIIIARPAVVGIDWNLIHLQMLVVDALKITMSLNSLDTGTHTEGSRHYDGRADDCNLIGTVGGPLMPATLRNRWAVRYVEFLLASGFQVGEGGPHAAVLFGPVGTAWNTSRLSHTTHVHTSLFKRALPGAVEGEEEADSCGAEVAEKEEGKGARVVQLRSNSAESISSSRGRASRLRGAFPPPFPPAKPRCLP